MSATIWKNIAKKYKGLWIALKSDEKTVVASGKHAKDVFNSAKQAGIEVPIMYKVPVNRGLYIGALSS